MAPRTPVVIGNWKMNGNREKVSELVTLLNTCKADRIDIICAPPSIYMLPVLSNVDERVQVALQNCHSESYGAYTGELSPEMGEDVGCKWVILGHCERRQKFGETDETIGRKIGHVMKNTNLNVIVCVGETLMERLTDQVMDVLNAQMQSIARNVVDWSRVIIAYDAVWATEVGIAPSPRQLQQVCVGIRSFVSTVSGEDKGEALRIVYGGSVNANNCQELKTEDLDGFLVGGAALKPDFLKIIACTEMQS